MRLIDADELKERIRKALGIKSLDNLLPSEKTIVNQIDMASTIQPEPHWIPVEQELPKLRHDVLLTVFFHEKWNVAEGYRQDGEFMFWNNGRLDSVLDEENRVIAWMPKPEPYKPTVPPECEEDCGWCKPTVIEKCKGVTE